MPATRAPRSLLLAATLFAAAAGAAAPGWQTHVFSGIPATRFETVGDALVDISADASAGLFYRPLSDAEAASDTLAWRWRVESAPPPVPITHKGGDDRAVAVMVAFPQQDDSLFGWMGRGLASLAGVPLQGRCITYVWGGLQPVGSSFRDPYLGDDGWVVVLRPGDAPQGLWFSERVNPREDYRRLFGEPAPAPAWIALTADSDHTRASTRATVAGL